MLGFLARSSDVPLLPTYRTERQPVTPDRQSHRAFQPQHARPSSNPEDVNMDNESPPTNKKRLREPDTSTSNTSTAVVLHGARPTKTGGGPGEKWRAREDSEVRSYSPMQCAS